MELTLGVTLAVLGAGMLHAGWNALLKSAGGGDPLLDTATVVAGSTACSLLVLPFVPLPEPAAWPFIAASTVIHVAYYLTLAQAYRTGDLSFAYPLMRGTAPLLVTVLGAVFLRELPPLHVIAGIVLISIGIIGIAFARREHHPPAAAWWAFANAAIIAVYTLVDGTGARASGNALAYVLWLTFIEGVVYLALLGRHRGAPAIGYVRKPVAARPAGRLLQRGRLRHRAVGDDARAGCRRGRVARDFRDLRGAHRRAVAEGRLRPGAAGRRRDRGHRRRDAEAVTSALPH